MRSFTSHFIYVFLGLLLMQCGSYQEDDLIGTWEIIEIKSEKNPVQLTFLGAKTVAFSADGKYSFPGSFNERGEWTVRGNKLLLHSNAVKDMTGSVVYEGHDSEWTFDKSNQYMIWRGTYRFRNHDLEVIFQKIE